MLFPSSTVGGGGGGTDRRIKVERRERDRERDRERRVVEEDIITVTAPRESSREKAERLEKEMRRERLLEAGMLSKAHFSLPKIKGFAYYSSHFRIKKGKPDYVVMPFLNILLI